MTEFAKLALDRFLEEIASQAPTPGGGTAAAVAGALGASLTEMVAALTLSKEKFADVHDAIRPIAEGARQARSEFLQLAQEDSQTYEGVLRARQLPKGSVEEKEERSRRVATANREATEVPMRTARVAVRLLAALPELVDKGNPNAVSDAGAAALLLEAATVSALLNVGINLPGVADPEFTARMNRETADLNELSQRLRAQVVGAVRKRF